MSDSSRPSFLQQVSALLFLLAASHFAIAQSTSNSGASSADRLAEGWWADRHKAVLEAIKSQPDTELLMIGDSITNNYDKSKLPDENFKPTWDRFYAPRKALNLGFSGDTTANVLWRLDHGEVDGLHPKVAVLLIGTNNTGRSQTPEQTEVGIDAIIASLEQHLPQTRILLVGVLPSNISATKTEADQAVNRYLANGYGENPRVTYLDIGSIFFKEGKLNTAIFYDPRLPLHPDTEGQRMMAEAIEPPLAKLMGDTPQVSLNTTTEINTALIPVPALEQDSYDWYARHHAELALEKQIQPRVVLIGDSITHFWGGLPNGNHVNGPQSWQRVFGAMPVINMGFGWDRTQNALWRLRQGEFNDLHPQWIVVNIGTNNLVGTDHARASTPAETAEGIFAICDEVKRRSPQSRILLMAIFPRGAKPYNRMRSPILETNRLLAQHFSGDPAVTLLDIGAKLLAPDGSLPAAIMPDATHPSDAGYQIWADALIQAGIKP